MEKADVKSMDITALEGFLSDLGEPKFRAGQIFSWLHEKQVNTFSEMTNLSRELRFKLEERAYITSLTMEQRYLSLLDGTVKYLYCLPDGEYVESVLMRYEHGLSICVSTQVGCKMGCSFCASTKAGFVRNLTPSEILEQIYASAKDVGEKISSVVLMGIGEPLDNYDNVLRFLSLLSHPKGLNLSLRHVSLSTCGLVPGIDRLREENLQLTLSVSLHASDDKTRDQIMPVNHRYPIGELMSACERYTFATHRRISYEYALIRGVNDNEEAALSLARLLKGRLCHVNLIPVNYVREAGFERSGKSQVYSFQKILRSNGINATVRRTLGADINAACGQLRRQAVEQEKEGREQA